MEGSPMSTQNNSNFANRSTSRSAGLRNSLMPDEIFHFPHPEKCTRMIKRSQELRRAGYNQGEIDDQVAVENGITGAELQVIWLYALEAAERDRDALIALAKNAVDFGCAARKNVFAECPGRKWRR
jgi:hypothetical protein